MNIDDLQRILERLKGLEEFYEKSQERSRECWEKERSRRTLEDDVYMLMLAAHTLFKAGALSSEDHDKTIDILRKKAAAFGVYFIAPFLN
jgi:hypothetical protein